MAASDVVVVQVGRDCDRCVCLGVVVFDVGVTSDLGDRDSPKVQNGVVPGLAFRATKRIFDISMSILLLPLLGMFAVWLLILNPFLNPGRLVFVQKRMGRDCRPFPAFKFRSMRASDNAKRSADCPLEVDRITPLGGILRKTRIDELPQILNVLRGEMSLVGPRPDYFDHAVHYLSEIPGYRERHAVRPGISGLAQTEVGYVEGVEATRRKVRADLYYISRSGFRLESWIVWRTFSVILRRAGS